MKRTETVIKCSSCGSTSYLTSYMIRHRDPETFFCPVCGFRITDGRAGDPLDVYNSNDWLTRELENFGTSR